MRVGTGCGWVEADGLFDLERGQRGRNCTCARPDSIRACGCWVTRCVPPARIKAGAGGLWFGWRQDDAVPGRRPAVRIKSLRGWESHPPEGVYEAPLCALVEFPAWGSPRIGLRKSKGPGATGAPGPCHVTTKNKHLHSSAPVGVGFVATGFSRWSFRCLRAHLPSPSKCKVSWD